MVDIRDFESKHQELKLKHKKANHIVYALRRVEPNGQIFEKSIDDGEPKGCGGAPVLSRLRGEDIVDCVIFVVRYFGGIKLGAGGMVRAYGNSAKSVIDVAEFTPYKKVSEFKFKSSYSDIRKIEYQLKNLGIQKVEKSFESEYILWTLLVSNDEVEMLKEHIKI